jgi:hypothetical protein
VFQQQAMIGYFRGTAPSFTRLAIGCFHAHRGRSE